VIRAAVLALVLAGVPAAARAEPPAPGVYGNVELSAESGDLGGAELELIGSGADARVELVICEGWCNAILTAPAKLSDGEFFFEFTEPSYDENGTLAGSRRYEAVATVYGEDISLTVVPDDPGANPFTYYLPRIDERFGLAVAAGED
jgi:hypothetical protein